MATLTYKYRIKDSQHLRWLSAMATKVNWAWNLAQETKLKHKESTGEYLKAKELLKLVKISGLHTQTTQQTIKQYLRSSRQFKRHKLNWRSSRGSRRSLGWIPCTNQSIKLDADSGNFKFCKREFKCWYSRPIVGRYLSSSINEDARGRWYINIVCEQCEQVPTLQNAGQTREIGIDLGCKDQIVCSDGVKYSRENITKKYEGRLSKAQRAGKAKQAKTIHAKIANVRKDWSHKTTTEICRTAKLVVVGDIESKKLMKTRLAKSISDAGMHQIKSQLGYKAIRHNVVVETVSEKRSTLTCSLCLQKTGPSGLSSLGVRHWECTECGGSHDRDVNAAVNILMSLQGIAGHTKGISAL